MEQEVNNISHLDELKAALKAKINSALIIDL